MQFLEVRNFAFLIKKLLVGFSWFVLMSEWKSLWRKFKAFEKLGTRNEKLDCVLDC